MYFEKISGTSLTKFIIGLLGPLWKATGGRLQARNNADTAFTGLDISDISLNNSTNKTVIQIPTGQSNDITLTLPADDGTAGQVLGTDGSGVLSWVSAASTETSIKTDVTSINFGSSGTISAFTLPANAVVERCSVIVDTAFDGTPSISVGVSSAASKYFGSGSVLLAAAGRYDEVYEGTVSGTSEAVEIYFSAGSASVGAARVIVSYSIPA